MGWGGVEGGGEEGEGDEGEGRGGGRRGRRGLAWLLLILEHIAHDNVPVCGVSSAVIATVSSTRSDGATNYTRCSISGPHIRVSAWFHVSHSLDPLDHYLCVQCMRAGPRHTRRDRCWVRLRLLGIVGGALAAGRA